VDFGQLHNTDMGGRLDRCIIHANSIFIPRSDTRWLSRRKQRFPAIHPQAILYLQAVCAVQAVLRHPAQLQDTALYCKEPSVFAFLHRYDERGEGTSLRSEVKKRSVTAHQLRRTVSVSASLGP
jgi:hypothetical protein